VGCTWEWESALRGGGIRKTVRGEGMGMTEHGMTVGNRNGLGEHGMA
jgi:hypothetical protein